MRTVKEWATKDIDCRAWWPACTQLRPKPKVSPMPKHFWCKGGVTMLCSYLACMSRNSTTTCRAVEHSCAACQEGIGTLVCADQHGRHLIHNPKSFFQQNLAKRQPTIKCFRHNMFSQAMAPMKHILYMLNTADFYVKRQQDSKMFC